MTNMTRKRPSYNKEVLFRIESVDHISEKDIAVTWRLIDEAFRDIEPDLVAVEISDGESSLPTDIAGLGKSLETFKAERINIENICISVPMAGDTAGNFRSCSLTFWFGDGPIKALWQVHTAGESIVEIRNWGKGLWDRVAVFLKTIERNEEGVEGVLIRRDGKIEGSQNRKKETKIIQEKVINQQIINAKKIQDSNINQNGNNSIAKAKQRNPWLEKMSWLVGILAGAIAIYLGLKAIYF